MSDPFEELEESRWGAVPAIIAAIAVVALVLALRWPDDAPVRMTGVVESAGAISVARIKGGTAETASIRLANGQHVTATVVGGGPLAPGDAVIVFKQQTMLGGAEYQVLAKSRPGQL